MVYSFTQACTQCGDCESQCPQQAIVFDQNQNFWIDPTVCDGCGDQGTPYCLTICPVDSPVILKPKKGRHKLSDRPTTSLELFLNGKGHAFASSMIVWEACNVLTQQQSLTWQQGSDDGHFYYQRPVMRGQGHLTFHLDANIDFNSDRNSDRNSGRHLKPLSPSDLDPRAACLNLICAAYAMSTSTPWQDAFVVNEQQLEYYLGLDKRKDLNKLAKLTLIKDLVQQACALSVEVLWPSQGHIDGFSIPKQPIWHLEDIDYHCHDDQEGCRHLTGLTFRIRPGLWTCYFLNPQGYQDRTAFYQYGQLPKSLLTEVMSIWQQHDGAIRLLIWLLFKARVGQRQPLTVQTLMRIAYGEERLNLACSGDKRERKKLLRLFEGDLEALYHYGLKPVFDPVTYPDKLQPFWARVADLPDDADAALEFWLNDGDNSVRVTDAAPKGKWKHLIGARILQFELPQDWEKQSKPAKAQKSARSIKLKLQTPTSLSGQLITNARKKLNLSQRSLAAKVGKSQSWIRDIERDRFQVDPQAQQALCKVLGLSTV
ncbi:MAG: helix-turn-helix domain-containing protein [Cyanobacteria bacterium P01_H01_bin.121]